VVTPEAVFPAEFFHRIDETDDGDFYSSERLVTHIDNRAIAAVGHLYESLGLTGRVLDIMSSWISHFRNAPAELVVLGMNARELDANPMATERVSRDLNTDPSLPFEDQRFDAVTCCVSVDYLINPVEVFREVRRVLADSGVFVCTFSNRCFPTKAISGWLATDDAGHCRIVSAYFAQAGGFDEPTVALCTPPSTMGDPLYTVWARRTS
jgi:SAM-dependent methyltransferase